MPRRILTTIGAGSLAVALLAVSPLTAQRADHSRPVPDMPVTEVPADSGHRLAVFWSGDGGWAALASQISRELAAGGVAVVGVNSRVWLDAGTRSPDAVAHDTERLLRAYLARWSRTRIVLIGYSRGADFLPFVINRLPADLQERLDLVVLLGAASRASFEFHFLDLVRDTHRPTDIPTLPEVQRNTTARFLCVRGSRETDSLCPLMPAARTRVITREGDHHFDRDYQAIARSILAALGS